MKKAQMITRTLFTICQKYGDHIRESWKNITGCIIRLSSLALLPSLVSLKDTFIFPDENIDPPKEPESTSLGMLALSNTASRFISTKETEDMDPGKKKNELTIKQFLKQCKLKDIVRSSKSFSITSLEYWLKVLISERSVNISEPNGAKSDTYLFCIDLITQIIILNKHRIAHVWFLLKDYMEHFANHLMPFNLVYKTVINLYSRDYPSK